MTPNDRAGKLVRFYSELQPQQQLSVFLLVATCGLSIFVAFLFNFGLGFYVALAAGTTLSLVTDRSSRFIFENKTMEQLDKLVKHEFALRAIGDSVAGLDWLIKNSDDIIHVDNTVFYRNNSFSFGTIDDKKVAQLKEAIKKIIDNGGRWHDVYMKDHKHAIEEFALTLNDKQKPSYFVTEIDSNQPLMQAMIIRYKANRNAVLFGWGYPGSEDYETYVFLGNSLETVNYFYNYINSLNKNTEISRLPAVEIKPAQSAPVVPPPQPS